MKHLGTKRLETDRLILRRYELSDAKMMFVNWASDERATTYLTWPAHQNQADTEEILHSWVGGYEDEDQYNWAITLKEDPREVIGGISVVSYSEARNECEIGYVLSPKYWGQGIMTETLKAVAEYLLTQVDFNRLEALFDVENVGSGRVMAKAGLKYEGTHRQYGKNNRGLVDMTRYAILRDDLKIEE